MVGGEHKARRFTLTLNCTAIGIGFDPNEPKWRNTQASSLEHMNLHFICNHLNPLGGQAQLQLCQLAAGERLARHGCILTYRRDESSVLRQKRAEFQNSSKA